MVEFKSRLINNDKVASNSAGVNQHFLFKYCLSTVAATCAEIGKVFVIKLYLCYL